MSSLIGNYFREKLGRLPERPSYPLGLMIGSKVTVDPSKLAFFEDKLAKRPPVTGVVSEISVTHGGGMILYRAYLGGEAPRGSFLEVTVTDQGPIEAAMFVLDFRAPLDFDDSFMRQRYMQDEDRGLEYVRAFAVEDEEVDPVEFQEEFREGPDKGAGFPCYAMLFCRELLDGELAWEEQRWLKVVDTGSMMQFNDYTGYRVELADVVVK